MFARIVFQSPLPALSREFEYIVPQSLVESIQLGQRVVVKFAGQTKEGFVVGLVSEPEFKGKLSEVLEIVADIPVLVPHIYELLVAISNRQCCSTGELIGNAVPKRSVRVEKSFSMQLFDSSDLKPGTRSAELVPAVANSDNGEPAFIARIAELATRYFVEGRSVIVCVPDFRDLRRVSKALSESLPEADLLHVDSNELGSERYSSFLKQLSGPPKIVLGTRNAIYSPVASSAALIIWDDGDQSHQDQQSPYLNTREIALIRQNLFSSPLHFLSHSRSAEVQRLVNIGFLKDEQGSSWRPKISLSDGRGLDGMVFKSIRRALEVGPVLVQVASPGSARSLYCAECSERSMCHNCNGPLWLNAKGQIACRWCGNLNLEFKCNSCGHSKLRQGAAGATRWAEQLGKSFPGIPVREVTVDKAESEIPNKPLIVVCTPGIEPVATGGFAGVALLDCASQLNVDSLRAPEDALRSWMNALGFMRADGEAVAVGVSPEVSKALSLGQIRETVNEILREREQLGFPPARRFLSATGSRETVQAVQIELGKLAGVRVLGIAESVGNGAVGDVRLVASFPFAIGLEVANCVRNLIGDMSASKSRINTRSGKAIRPLSIKFDDPRVI